MFRNLPHLALAAVLVALTATAAQAEDLSGTYLVQAENGAYLHEDGLGDQLVSSRYQPDDDFVRFVLERYSDGSYRIRVKADNLYVHYDGEGDRLVSTRYQETDDFTRFFFEERGNGFYRIRSKATGELIHLAETDGLVSARQGLQSTFSRFKLVREDKFFEDYPTTSFVNRYGLCLDVFNYSLDPGAQLIQWPCRDQLNENQHFRLIPKGDGYFQVRAAHSNFCLEESGGRFIQNECLLTDNGRQLFTFSFGNAGVIQSISSRSSGMCMTVPATSENGLEPFPSSCAPNDRHEFAGDVPRCVDGEDTLCLNEDRFKVTVDFVDFQGNTGTAHAAPGGTDDSGNLWFFNANNWEMLIKVVNGCQITNHFWVFFAATTNVEFTVTVEDTLTGDVKSYFNPLGNAANAITDTSAFATCN